MGARVALIYTVVAKSPVSFIADVATPVAKVGPGLAPYTERATLETLTRIVGRQRLSAIGSAWRTRRRQVSTSSEHVWHGHVLVRVLTSLFPLLPCTVSKAKPVLATLTSSVTAQADVPLATRANITVVMQLVFDVCLSASGAANGRLRVEL